MGVLRTRIFVLQLTIVTFGLIEFVVPAAAAPAPITSDYGANRIVRRPFGSAVIVSMGKHDGIDFGAPAGTPVLSASFGIVQKVSITACSGGVVMVKHPAKHQPSAPSDTGGATRLDRDVYVIYVHVNPAVKKGDRLEPGQRIAVIADSSRLPCANGDHLHFMVSHSQRNPAAHTVNPHQFWVNGSYQLSCYEAGKVYSSREFAIISPIKCE